MFYLFIFIFDKNILQSHRLLNSFFSDSSLSWYREGSNSPLPATVLRGGTKDQPTNATLLITPRREDDGAKYKCVVRNRAMNEGKRLEATTTLNVNCKYSEPVTLINSKSILSGYKSKRINGGKYAGSIFCKYI